MIHGSERASYPGGGFRAAKQSLLQDRRENQYGRAPNKIIPEVTDIRRREQDEDEHLRNQRRKNTADPVTRRIKKAVRKRPRMLP